MKLLLTLLLISNMLYAQITFKSNIVSIEQHVANGQAIKDTVYQNWTINIDERTRCIKLIDESSKKVFEFNEADPVLNRDNIYFISKNSDGEIITWDLVIDLTDNNNRLIAKSTHTTTTYYIRKE